MDSSNKLNITSRRFVRSVVMPSTDDMGAHLQVGTKLQLHLVQLLVSTRRPLCHLIPAPDIPLLPAPASQWTTPLWQATNTRAPRRGQRHHNTADFLQIPNRISRLRRYLPALNLKLRTRDLQPLTWNLRGSREKHQHRQRARTASTGSRIRCRIRQQPQRPLQHSPGMRQVQGTRGIRGKGSQHHTIN